MAVRNIGELSEDEQARLVVKYLARKAASARLSQGAFFEFVMREETSQAPLKVAPHQQLFFDFVEAHPLCVLMLPVGTSKTFGVASMGMHNLGLEPTMRGGLHRAQRRAEDGVPQLGPEPQQERPVARRCHHRASPFWLA